MKQSPNVEKKPMEGRHGTGPALLRRLGATRSGAWVIKHSEMKLSSLWCGAAGFVHHRSRR